MWRTYSEYLKKKYNKKVFRVGLDAGFSCPNRTKERLGGCAFCDGTGSVAVYQRKGEGGFHHDSDYNKEVAENRSCYDLSIKEQIEKGKEFLIRRYKAEAFSLYFQSFTNTYGSVDQLKRIYDDALSYGPFVSLIISTRPDEIDDDKLALIKSYEKNGLDVEIELGLQSANNRTLEYINRGHSAECYIDAAKKIKEYGIFLSTHVILGLPGENSDDFIKTADVVNLYSDAVKIHNLQITGGTRLQKEWEEGKIKLLSLDEYLDAVSLFIAHLREDVVIQRLISETPSHRLIEPRDFPDKSKFINMLKKRMEERDEREGKYYKKG